MTEIIMFTDGASKGNPGAGGWGVVIYKDRKEIFSNFGGGASATNNQMELMGLIKGMEIVGKGELGQNVNIYSDSEYVVKGVNEWMNNWARRNWKTASGGPVQNLDLWQRLHSLMKQYGNLVNVSWVKGHQNNNSFLAQGNARADELANQGVYGNGVHLQRPMVNTPIDPQEGDKPMAHLSDEHLIYQALSMWINYIETGSVNMSANDARRCGCAAEVKGLDNDQRRFIERLRGLQDVALSTSRRMTP